MQKSIFKYQNLVSSSTKEEVVLRELKALVDFALWTPLQVGLENIIIVLN